MAGSRGQHSIPLTPRVPGGGLLERPPERERQVLGGSMGGVGVAGAGVGGGMQQRGTDIIGAVNQLTQMDNPESKLALNILSAVLSSVSASVHMHSVLASFSAWLSG